MAWAVRASLTAVLGKARRDGASAAGDGTPDAAGGRVRLLVEMEAAFAGTVEMTADMTVQDVRVEFHVSNDGEPDADDDGTS